MILVPHNRQLCSTLISCFLTLNGLRNSGVSWGQPFLTYSCSFKIGSFYVALAICSTFKGVLSLKLNKKLMSPGTNTLCSHSFSGGRGSLLTTLALFSTPERWTKLQLYPNNRNAHCWTCTEACLGMAFISPKRPSNGLWSVTRVECWP